MQSRCRNRFYLSAQRNLLFLSSLPALASMLFYRPSTIRPGEDSPFLKLLYNGLSWLPVGMGGGRKLARSLTTVR